MSKLKVFIGSSVEGLVYAQCLADTLNRTSSFDAEDWVTFFDRKPGSVNIHTLFDALDEFDIALFFITGDYGIADISFNRLGKKIVNLRPGYYGAKPNVWFEHGLFTGRLGIEKSQILIEEKDAKTRPLMTLSDYYGVNPYTYKLDQSLKDEILRFAQEKQKMKELLFFSELNSALKKALNKSFKDLGEILVNEIDRFRKAPLYYTVQAFKNRIQCYEQGQKMINEAEDRIYTSLTYEGELNARTKGYYPGGLWPVIKEKIDRLKAKNVKPGEAKKIFKRYLNLANEQIFRQAEDILTNYQGYIEIKDTYCHFIEVVITDDKVLLVLPDSKEFVAKVDTGIFIHSREVAEEFADWFEKLVPEPHKMKIDSVANLKKYRNFLWNESFKRDGTLRCSACTLGVPLPTSVQKRLKSLGLLN